MFKIELDSLYKKIFSIKGAKGIFRLQSRVVKTASKVNRERFLKDHIYSDDEVETDCWNGYKAMEAHFPKLVREKSGKKGENFKQMCRVIMMFKAWPRGTYHLVINLQPYINEYTYRFNRHKMK